MSRSLASGARPCRRWPAASSCGGQAASPALLSAGLVGCLVVVSLRVSRAAVPRPLRAAFSGLVRGSRVSSSSLVTLRGAVAWCVVRWGSRVARASRCGGWREVPALGATLGFAGLQGQICFGPESRSGSPIGPRVSSIGSSASQLPRARAVARTSAPAQSYGGCKFQVASLNSELPVLAEVPVRGASQGP